MADNNDPVADDSMVGDPTADEERNIGFILPGFDFIPNIPHYYGDYVRQVFLTIGAAMLVVAPLTRNYFDGSIPLVVGFSLALVTLGALTSPRKPWVLLGDSVAAVLGVLFFELRALDAIQGGSLIVFIIFEAIVVAFLFALYFSVKTYRAMLSGRIGKQARYGELDA